MLPAAAEPNLAKNWLWPDLAGFAEMARFRPGPGPKSGTFLAARQSFVCLQFSPVSLPRHYHYMPIAAHLKRHYVHNITMKVNIENNVDYF